MFVSKTTVRATLFLVQQPVHELFALVFRQALPIQPALGAELAQLCPAETDSLIAPRLGFLREGEQCIALSFGGQLPHQRNHLLIRQVPAWSKFLEGCLRYRQSHDEQAPNAPRAPTKHMMDSSMNKCLTMRCNEGPRI